MAMWCKHMLTVVSLLCINDLIGSVPVIKEQLSASSQASLVAETHLTERQFLLEEQAFNKDSMLHGAGSRKTDSFQKKREFGTKVYFSKEQRI
jgi:hypothetical protein